MEAGCSKLEPIYLTYLNGTGYVFNVDDYMKIRTEYRILGAFMGTCSFRGWTPGLNGLPAEFNRYETQLLLEKGYAILLDKSKSLTSEPDNEKIEKYKELLSKRIHEQADFLKENKLAESRKHIDKILAGKKNKLIKSGVDPKDITLTEEDILNEIERNITFCEENALLEIPYEHNWEHEGEVVHLPPDTSLQYQVFKDVWEKGKYITSGEAFGGDFIIYPGDPLMFHASHIIIVLDKPSIHPLDLISKCRLSVTVNKKCVIAYYNNHKNQLSYQTIEWEGCKDKEFYSKQKKKEDCSSESEDSTSTSDK